MKSRSITAMWILLSSMFVASAQNFSIDWFTIDGGGGTSRGGNFSLSGTIGQPDAGVTMKGVGFALNGGFWSLVTVPTPGVPLLTIELTSISSAVVSWPSPSAGFTLQQRGELDANWSAVPQSINDNGTNRFIIVGPPTGNRFYRLFKP